jgi:Homeodomain
MKPIRLHYTSAVNPFFPLMNAQNGAVRRPAEAYIDVPQSDNLSPWAVCDRFGYFRRRSVLNEMQKVRLKWAFYRSRYPSRDMVSALSKELQMSEAVVRVYAMHCSSALIIRLRGKISIVL